MVSDGGCWLAGSQCPEKEKQGCSHCCTWHGKYGQYQEGCGKDCSQYVCRKGISILVVIAPAISIWSNMLNMTNTERSENLGYNFAKSYSDKRLLILFGVSGR